MSRMVHRKSVLSLLLAFVMVASFASGSAFAHSTSPRSSANNHPLCRKIGTTLWVSTAARMWCSPPQPNGSSTITSTATSGSSANVNAANPAEDVTPSGVRAYGQSETSIAGIGPYVVEAWNDVTGFLAPCPSPMNKEEGTGYGFSADGGASFVDEGGPPNANCREDQLFGDPSVAAWRSGGSAYFYISSLYLPSFSGGPPSDPRTFVAINACKASGKGATASIRCSQPIIVASSTECLTQKGFTFCSFLDKEYLSIDPRRGRLYMSYTEFGINPPMDPPHGQIELAACDIGTLDGGTGPSGGTAGHPACKPGASGTPRHLTSPYFVAALGSKCANTGAYPAVDVATGDVYVAFEFNLGTDLFEPACTSIPTLNVVKYIPFACLTLPTTTCRRPAASNAVKVVSMETARIPGYTRFPLQDFPRIAVSDRAGTVSIVWNDAGEHPLGDILLQSFALGSLSPVQKVPMRLNSQVGGLHFLPALRNANQDGNLNVSWYERRSPTTALTNVFAALNLDPRTTSTPVSNRRVTTVASDWNNVTELPNFPNFGDYTDNDLIATASAPYVGEKLYVAWADGRTGVPQPFEAYVNTN